LWFEDLSPCTYFPVDVKLVAVGWLERGRPYAGGDIDRDVFDALVEMRKDPWQPLVCPGFHDCICAASRVKRVVVRTCSSRLIA